MTGWTAIAHAVIAVAVLGALVLLALFNKISGADAFTGIIGVAIAAGVIAGVNTNSPPSTPATPVVRPVTTTVQKG